MWITTTCHPEDNVSVSVDKSTNKGKYQWIKDNDDDSQEVENEVIFSQTNLSVNQKQ